MSAEFQNVMKELSATLKGFYHADSVAIIPGSGTSGMEAVARQLATDKNVVVVRNGWFSHRWVQILKQGRIANTTHVFNAQIHDSPATFSPANIDEVTAFIRQNRPNVVFAPHVETASGMMLSDGYVKALGQAVHDVGGILVIDCIASGCVWLDMKAWALMCCSLPHKKACLARLAAGL